MDSLNHLPEGTPQGERRQATILFADISGFTSLSETMDAEIVSGLMNEIYAILGKAVEDRGGVVCRLFGDCLMALFGAPSAVEHAPWRAVDAALEMRQRLRNFLASRNLSSSLDLHTGVNTGEVVSGTVGSESKQEYTVYGDAVNVASRLKDAAPKGTIYVGPQTYRSTQEVYEYRKLDPLILKGKSNPIEIYELNGRRPAQQEGGKGADRLIRSRMVGREKDLEVLESQVLKALQGEGAIVHVVGEAGLGKSRLIAELRDRECLRQVTILEGRAQSFGRNLSYHPVIDLLKKWAGIGEQDEEAEELRKLEEAIRSVSSEDADEALPFIARLMGMSLTGKHAQRMEGIIGDTLAKLIFKTVRDLLSRGAQRKPLVIVLEDMHWADESTAEFVEYLFRMVEKERVLFVNVFRPREEMGERLSKTAREGYGSRYREMVLHPLDREGCSELVRNLLSSGNLPSSMIDSIVRRTGGNPFFVEEIIRACIDERALEVGREGFRVTDRIGSFVVPSTVNEVIMSRFDRLDEATREMLRVASVIGRSFFYRVLVQVASGVREIDEKIDSLKEMQLILEQRRMEEVEYLFKHALAQEAIYDSILLQVRKNLHLSVARAIEMTFAERLGMFAGMLALHYTRGEDYEKAEAYMIRAGAEALKSAASSEALTYYREALELYVRKHGESADPAKVAMLEKYIARSLLYRGRYAEAIPYYDRLLRYYGIHVPKGGLAVGFSVMLGLVKFMFWLYWPDRKSLKHLTPKLHEGLVLALEKLQVASITDASSMFLQAFVLFRQVFGYDLGNSEPGLMLLGGVSSLFSFSGMSLSLSRRSIEKMSPVIGSNLPQAWIWYLLSKSIYGYIVGEWGQRGSFRHPLIKSQSEQGNAFNVLTILLFLGNACLECGDWETYFDARRKLEVTSDRLDNDYGRMNLVYLTLRYYIKRRMWEEATNAIPEFLKFFSGSSGSFGEIGLCWAYALFTRVALLGGDFESAAAYLSRIPSGIAHSVRGINQSGYFRWAYAAIAVEKARRAVAMGRLDRRMRRECLAALHRNMKNARKFAPDRTEALKFIGSYWWHVGSRRRALAYWRQSLREGERLSAKVELGHTFSDAGKLLGELEPGPEWRKQGAELYAELGIRGQ